MNTFAELHALFRDEVMELCLRECFEARRPVFYVDAYEEFDDKCGFCGLQQCLFPRSEYKHKDVGGWQVPGNFRERTCGAEECREFSDFFSGPRGYARRKRFRKMHRAEPEWYFPLENRVPAMLAFILEWEVYTRGKKKGAPVDNSQCLQSA